MIVDDDQDMLKVLGRTLELEGFSIAVAADGNSALTLLEERRPDLLILDIMMPGKSGVDLLPEITASYPDIAVIMSTAVTDTHTAIHCMKRGAYDYIIKPFNLRDVILTVNQTLKRRGLRLKNKEHQQHLEQRVEAQAKKIRASFLNSITALAFALEAKDKYTSGHSQRVAKIALAIARELGMPPKSIEKIRLAGSIHDIGKIGVRETILNKPSKLIDEEYRHVMSHCEIGERILSPIVDDNEILDMVRHHHERYDGTGYPDRLAGKPISQEVKIAAVGEACVNKRSNHTEGGTLTWGASILAVADAYDAMTSVRSYRTALPAEAALEEIRRGSGTQFTPSVVNAFLKTPVTDIMEKGDR
jgi:putative nucleotidyltransferase with HDIG domain